MGFEVLEVANRNFEADIRWANDLEPVLAYPEAVKENFKAYFMFRDVYYSVSDKERIRNVGLRYDITIIPPNMVGKEYIKTYGHIHPVAESKLSYTEIYEVLEGEAKYLLQKEDNSEFIVVNATKGDKVIIPPNYGHVTINASNKVLKMANWVYRNFSSKYGPYKEKRGACYYYTEDGWIENKNYEVIPEIKEVKVRIPKSFNLKKSEEMYKLLKTPEKMAFLYEPSKYMDLYKEAFEY